MDSKSKKHGHIKEVLTVCEPSFRIQCGIPVDSFHSPCTLPGPPHLMGALIQILPSALHTWHCSTGKGLGSKRERAALLHLKAMKHTSYLFFGHCEEGLGIEAKIFEKYFIVSWNHEEFCKDTIQIK